MWVKKKMKKKAIKILIIIVVACLVIVGVLWINKMRIEERERKRREEEREMREAIEIIASSKTVLIQSGEKGVKEFIEIATKDKIDFESEDMDGCYNITPSYVEKNSEYEIYKFADTAETYLLHDNNIYKLGEHKNGYGVTSLALIKNNKTGESKLLFSYTWNIGVYRTNFGYFDSEKKEVILFTEKQYRDEEMVLVKRDDVLSVCHANFNEFKDFTNFKLTADMVIEDVIITSNEVKLSK